MTTNADRLTIIRGLSADDQSRFAELSGDTNPLHLDPIEARRTLMGEPVVHGVHLVLLALEVCCGAEVGTKLSALRARFPNPVLVGDSIEMRLTDGDGTHLRIEGYVQSDLVLELTGSLSRDSAPDDVPVSPLEPEPLHDLRFSDLMGVSGSLHVGIDAVLARSLFPAVTGNHGLPVVAELLALTRLVGMRCPGRHSLFSQFDVTFDRSGISGALNYRVTGLDGRFLRVNIEVEGARLSGKLTAFFRPLPQPQPSMTELSKMVGPDEFRNCVALVVGGSRGLGEASAKLLAAGGARVHLSYNSGERDAARVAAEIKSWGGSCECCRLDVLDSAETVRKIYASAAPPRTIYYFATPRIFARRRRFLSQDLLEQFVQYYVIGFSKLIDSAAEQSKIKLRIFVPSTTAIDENLREIAEYSMAKRMAEDLCAFYNRFSDKIEITSVRLPRLKTDQTTTLIEVPAADCVEVMLPIVRRVELNLG